MIYSSWIGFTENILSSVDQYVDPSCIGTSSIDPRV